VCARPNKGLELTASSVRSYVAPASGSSSGLAFGITMETHESSLPEGRITFNGGWVSVGSA